MDKCKQEEKNLSKYRVWRPNWSPTSKHGCEEKRALGSYAASCLLADVMACVGVSRSVGACRGILVQHLHVLVIISRTG